MASRRYELWRVKRTGYPPEATAAHTVGEEMSGLLEKKGRGLGCFKRYFFTTNNLYLRYYASEDAAENDPPLGVYFLSALVRVVRTDPRCINLLFVKGIKSKQKRLRADTPELAQQWQDMFTRMIDVATEHYDALDSQLPSPVEGPATSAAASASAAAASGHAAAATPQSPSDRPMRQIKSMRLNVSGGEGYDPQNVLSERTTKDGTTIIKFRDGATLQKRDGVSIMMRPDGRRLQTNANGTTIETLPDGTRIQIDAKGVQTERQSDGTVTQTRPDGTVQTKRPDGTRIQHRIDGTVVRVDAQGNTKQWNPDGTEVENIGNIQRITSRNGQTTEIAGGTSTIIRQAATRQPIPEGYYARLGTGGRVQYFNIKTQESTYDRPKTAAGMEEHRKQRFEELKSPRDQELEALPGRRASYSGVSPSTQVVVDWWARQRELVAEADSKLDLEESGTVLRHFRTVKKFNWNGCVQITESALAELSYWCPEMHNLDVSNCVQVQSLEALLKSEHCTKLTTIKMAGCTRCTDDDLKAMAALFVPKFKALDISECHKVGDGAVTAVAKRCKRLQKLNMRGVTNLSDASIISLAKACQKLRWLNIEGCRFITDEAMAALCQCTRLTHLDVTSCKLVTDRGVIKVARSCTALVMLNVNACAQVTNLSVKEISSHCPDVEVLGFRRCFRMDDNAMTAMCELAKLRSLCVQGCYRITEEGKAALKASLPKCEFTA